MLRITLSATESAALYDVKTKKLLCVVALPESKRETVNFHSASEVVIVRTSLMNHETPEICPQSFIDSFYRPAPAVN